MPNKSKLLNGLDPAQQEQLRDTTRGGFQSPLKSRNTAADVTIAPARPSHLIFTASAANRQAYIPLGVAPERAILALKTVTSNNLLAAPAALQANVLTSQTQRVPPSTSPNGIMDFFQRVNNNALALYRSPFKM